MNYTVELSPSVKHDLKYISERDRNRILQKFISLAANPRPARVIKVKGKINQWRVRVGDYRIVYEIYDTRLVVLVIRIRHRREVYEK